MLAIAIDPIEYSGKQPDYLPARLTESLASLVNQQLAKLDKFAVHRRRLAKIYSQIVQKTSLKDNPEQKLIADGDYNLLRYPLVLPNSAARAKLLAEAKKLGIVLGDWYKEPLFTPAENWGALGYKAGTCKQTEEIASRIVNLPLQLNAKPEDAERIGALIQKLF